MSTEKLAYDYAVGGIATVGLTWLACHEKVTAFVKRQVLAWAGGGNHTTVDEVAAAVASKIPAPFVYDNRTEIVAMNARLERIEKLLQGMQQPIALAPPSAAQKPADPTSEPWHWEKDPVGQAMGLEVRDSLQKLGLTRAEATERTRRVMNKHARKDSTFDALMREAFKG